MKSTFKLLLTMFTAILLLTNCKKNDSNYNAYFYTSMSSSETQLSLFIDDEYRGEIPYMIVKPNCDNDVLKQQALFVNMKGGKHKLVAKNNLGIVMSSGMVKVSKNKLSSSSGKDGRGGQDISSEGECLIVGLYY